MRPDKPLSVIEFHLYRHYRIVHGCRIALAFVLTFLLVRGLHIPEGSWPLISLVVVMGPISLWGNVLPRALQRIGGTLAGSVSGLIALKLELISLPGMLMWAALVMFFCSYLALGKHPYMALLTGITLAVISGAPAGDMETALWRAGDVILGSLLALVFSSIFPQKAYIHWRIRLSDSLAAIVRLHQAAFSPNLLQQPRLNKHLQLRLAEMLKMRTLLEPACKETRIPMSVLEGIQTVNRNMLCTLELQISACWSSRESHFLLLNSITFRRTREMTVQTLQTLSAALLSGNTDKITANNAELTDISDELRQLVSKSDSSASTETQIHSYVWLSLEIINQLTRISELIRLAMRK